jgi:ketosteroid isomerase-like protein
MAYTNDPTTTVRRMFTAFGTGDLDAVLDNVHPDSHWTYLGANPELTKADFVGKESVRKFFDGIIERLEFTEFSPAEFIVQGDTIVVFGSEAGKVKATGQAFRNEWTQKYVVEDNQITRMMEYNIQVEPR